MDRDRMEGKIKEGTGWAKDKAGEATGNEDLAARSEAERAAGKVKDAAGDAADAVKDKVGR